MGDRFEAIVGAQHVSRAQGQTLCGARVEAVVRPGSAAEVAACLRAASESGLAVLPVGGGTKLGFGNPLAAAECVRLELGRLAERTLDPDEGIAELGAGVSLAELERATAAIGKASTFDPLWPSATVGGAIAVDPVTPELSADVRLRGDLLGLEVALANGEVTRCGGRVVKNVTGFDLVRLYCGSFGTLGVVTSAIVRLRAAAKKVAVTRVRFASFEAAVEACARAAIAGPAPCAAVTRDGDGALLLTRFAGSEAEVDARLEQALGEPAELDAWARVRAQLARAPSPGTVRVRLGARPSDVAVLCRGLAAAAGDSAVELALPAVGVAFASVETDALGAVAEVALRAGATFALERAPGGAPPPCDAFGAPPQSLALMRALKARFDPTRTLSPGRFVAGI
jgi:glycolate oxidase FAD binding subunit